MFAQKTINTLKSALGMYSFLELAKVGAVDERIRVRPVDVMAELDALLEVPSVHLYAGLLCGQEE